MNEFIISFSLGIFGLTLFFALSVAIVFCAKAFLFYVEHLTPKKVNDAPPMPQVRQEQPPKPRAKRTPSVIRTIEIDPNQIDRIFVKKAH